MKDERLDKMNQEYHEIFIPAELRQRVETGIREAKKDMETERQTTIERKKKPMKKKNNKMITFAKTVGGAAAAALIAITVMANSGASIAHAGENTGHRSYRGGCHLPGISGQHQSDVRRR